MLVKHKEFFKTLVDRYDFFVLTDSEERRIREVLTKRLESVGKPEYAEVLFVAVKELLVNAMKANVKRIVENTVEYEEIISKLLKKVLKKEMLGYLREKLRANELEVSFRIYEIPGGLSFEVYNNLPLTPEAEARMREKLKEVMSRLDEDALPVELLDETEGMGLGLALVVWLLKNSGVDPKYFRVGPAKPGHTFSRIEVPVNDRFVSVRDLH